ncbi:penicillin-binding protein 2 [Vallitalea pronyensis]|uniref:Penicillin-binding protein 2 n=1 Tax=Vallitalea pronyensis TaxID=1348613 RepID=A0A8J8SHA2_9FIRM|nr:penicillin-binding protein 2 [Vallitalea pronyensis]QUI23202.1 penicillin-binding protein 2 [Vallitalea pronyensis]
MKSKKFLTYPMKRKLVFLFFVFICGLAALTVRIYSIVTSEGSTYGKSVLSQKVNNSVRYNQLIDPKRGTIYDRNGRVFAESKKVYHIIFDPGVLSRCDEEDRDETVNFLVDSFGVLKTKLEDLVENKSYSNYELVAKNLDYNDIEEEYEIIKKGTYKGLYLQEVYNRYYPGDNMLSDALGFVNKNNQGSWGVEETYDNELKGEEGRAFGVINDGHYIQNKYVKPQNGNDVVLTIDQTLQYYVEKAIKENLETTPKNVYAIATNPQNGEILAMASYPDFNLNDPYDLDAFLTEEEQNNMTQEEKTNFLYGLWNNFNISGTYEPGSTFKPFVMAMAIEEKKISLNTKYMCKGSKYVGGWNIACWERGGHGEQTWVEALENSCNVAMMDIAVAIGGEVFEKYMGLFGFTNRTNIDLIGEAEPQMHEEKSMGPVELATSSFGQSFNITPIQLMTSFGSLVNGGYIYEPHIVKKIVNPNGNVVSATSKRQLRQPISTETAQMIKDALRSVVENGTGKGVQIAGYDIGGKSGTAEKLPRDAEKHMVSFMATAPVDNPELLLLVIVDEPDVKKPRSIYAQKIVKQIMEDALPYMNLYPRTGETVEPLIFELDGDTEHEGVEGENSPTQGNDAEGENGHGSDGEDSNDTSNDTNENRTEGDSNTATGE